MKRPNVVEDIQPLSDFRNRMAAMLDQTNRTGRPLVLTQHGRAVAVMLSPEEYERLVYTEAFKAAVNEGLASLDAGKGIPQREAMAELRRRHRERTARNKRKARA